MFVKYFSTKTYNLSFFKTNNSLCDCFPSSSCRHFPIKPLSPYKSVKAGIIHMKPASEVIDNCLGRLSKLLIVVHVHNITFQK